METQIDPKLSHLSESQIQTLIARYYSDEIIHALLREYRIDCIPNQLHSLFPAEILNDLSWLVAVILSTFLIDNLIRR